MSPAKRGAKVRRRGDEGELYTFVLTRDIKAEIARRTRKRKRSQSEFVRDALNHYFYSLDHPEENIP